MKKLTLEELAHIAKAKGGECLSDTYVNCFKPMKWRCQNGHVWTTPAANIKQGRWCHICCRIESGKARQKYTIVDAQQYAEQHGGQCLSIDVKSIRDCLKWECANGHVWSSKLCNMIRKRYGKACNHWCVKCQTMNQTHTLDEIQQIAKDRNGKCLSSTYIGCEEHLEWMCEEGHVWSASLNNVKNNLSWCPECSTSRGERLFRQSIERITGKKFPKRRPIWLIDDQCNNVRLELDGYCEELKIAFDFQGRQHLEYIPHMHKSVERYEKIIRRDRLKTKICTDRGIKLLTPTSRLKTSEYESFIKTTIK